jgi:antitoxin PrlF
MHTYFEEFAMEATVAERGQITLPKAVRDALGLTKGTLLKVELDGSRIILRKNVDDAISRVRGKFKLDGFESVDHAVRTARGHSHTK